jgi:hypothetical protein
MTGTAETFLTPRLAAATTHLGTGLGRGGAGTSGCKLCSDYLMEDMEIGLDPKHLVVQLDVTAGGAIGLEERSLHLSHASSPPP